LTGVAGIVDLIQACSVDMAPDLTRRAHQDDLAIAQAESPELQYVNWRKDKGLRKLYFYAAIISIASATTGYDW
jgi:hypothetical protein